MSQIPGQAGNATDFLALIDTLLANPAGRITVASADIFAHVDNALLDGLLKHSVGEKPSTFEYVKDVLLQPSPSSPSSGAANAALGTLVLAGRAVTPVAGLAALALGHGYKTFKHAKKQRHIAKAAPSFTISRAAIGLKENERAALRGMAHLRAENKIDWPPWSRFYCQLAWGGGHAEVVPPASWASSIHIDDARRYLNLVCSHVFPDHARFLELAAAELGKYANENSDLGRMIQSILHAGARWLSPDDAKTSRIFKTTRTPAALQIGGFKPGQQPLYFDGSESLATIAGPGTGKSAAQVIRIAQSGGKDLTIDPHGMLLFSNTQKDADNPTRPDYWGYYNPGGGERLMRLAVWARTDSRGNAMLTGNIQRDEPRAKDVAPSKTKAKAKTRETEPSL